MDDQRVLIFVPPPLKISQEILQLNKLIAAKYTNTYMEHANFEWRSHLMVYLSPLPKENLNKIVQQVEEVATETKQFTVKLGNIIMTAEGYLYIEAHAPELTEIRNQLVTRLSALRGTGIKEKYLQNWDAFSREEQQRIKDTGLPYVYEPHLTIAKVSPEEVESALGLMRDVTFVDQEFTATQILVSQDDLVSTDWPIVGKFPFLPQ